VQKVKKNIEKKRLYSNDLKYLYCKIIFKENEKLSFFLLKNLVIHKNYIWENQRFRVRATLKREKVVQQSQRI